MKKAVFIGLIVALMLWNGFALADHVATSTAQDISREEVSDTVVYYNIHGGKYYHGAPECKLVDSRYLPMKRLSIDDLSKREYTHLIPCQVCISQHHTPFIKQIIEPAHNDISADMAIDIARREIADMVVRDQSYVASLPCRAHFIPLKIHGIDTKTWIVSFFPDNDSAVVYSVAIDSPSGTILYREANFFWDFAETWKSWGWDDFEFWSTEEKALYHSIYQNIPTRIYPEADSIPQEKALQIAKDTVQKMYKLSDDEMSFYKVDYNYVPSWYVRQSHNAWLIMLRPSTGTGSMYQIVLSAVDGTVYSCDRNDEAYPAMHSK